MFHFLILVLANNHTISKMKIRESKLSSVMIFFKILENLLKISMDLIDIDLDVDPDPLVEHIRDSGLPLKMRPPTLSDGNC